MNKQAAKKATGEFAGTVGDLRELIDNREMVSHPGEMSAVNPGVPLLRALEVYMNALTGRDDAEKITIWRQDPYSPTNGVRRSGDAMIVQNILRDCT